MKSPEPVMFHTRQLLLIIGVIDAVTVGHLSLCNPSFSQDDLLQTHPIHWVSGISKSRASFKPGQDNLNTIQLRTSDPHSSFILTYFVPVKMSDLLSESYSAPATPAKTSEIDPRQKILGWLIFYWEAAESVQPTLDRAWLRVCWISSPCAPLTSDSFSAESQPKTQT